MEQKHKARGEPHYYSDRLIKKLSGIRSASTTIVVAPSGCGKTTAVRDFLEAELPQSTPVYWFTATDEQPAACFLRFANSIGRIDGRAGQRLANIGLPNAATIGEACDALRSIECRHEAFLVADNFQYLLAALSPSFFAALMEHGGEGLHVVVVAQMLKRKMLSVVASRGVLQINAGDLRLNADDIGRYYSQAGVRIAQKDAEDIARNTGGWIIAVYLQLRAFRETGTFSDTSGILALMEHLVWDALTEAQQTFLLRLSPFEMITVQQACILGGCETLPEYALNALQNPFIRHEPVERRYELHSILTQLLIHKRAERGGAFERECLLRAGDFCRDGGKISEALGFYAQIKDYERMLSLDFSHLLLENIGAAPFTELALDIAQNCPADIKRRHLLSMLRVAWALLIAWRNESFDALMGELRKMLDAEDGEDSGLLGEWTLLSSFKSFPRLGEMTATLTKAAALFKGKDSRVILPEAPWCFGDYSQFAEFHICKGEADREADELETYVALYSRMTGGHGSGADVLFRAELAYYRGETGEAEILAYKALFLAESKQQSIIQLSAARLLAEIAQIRADTAGWRSAISSMERAASYASQNTFVVRSVLDTVRGLLLAELQVPADMAEWLKKGEFSGKLLLTPMVNNALYVHLLYLLIQGEFAQLIGVAQAVPPEVGRKTVFAEILVSLLLAVGYLAVGERAKSASYLRHAAELAMPDGLVYLFASLAELLGGLADELIVKEYPELYETYLRIKEGFGEGKAKLARDLSPEDLPEALTAREREVALLAARGLRNGEIAQKLNVTDSTVRTHLRTAFQKLDVDRRTKLAEKLKNFEDIPPSIF
ncbi:MAG: LuxR C-terminal-related transcriptional regulator [Bacillota bacterium]